MKKNTKPFNFCDYIHNSATGYDYKESETLRKLKFRNLLLAVSVISFFFTCFVWSSILKTKRIPLKPTGQTIEVKPKQVKAVETKCDYDPITYIRCRGESLGMSNKDITKAIRIARCESNFDQYAKNKSSTAKGIYQFIDGTWRSNCLKDGNVYDFKDNINCFWKVYSKQGDSPWVSSINCWGK